jgi:ABC-type sugar transport system permease subunit
MASGGEGIIQANMTNQYIVLLVASMTGNNHGFSAAMSWIYYGVIIAIMLVVFLVYKIFTRGDKA